MYQTHALEFDALGVDAGGLVATVLVLSLIAAALQRALLDLGLRQWLQRRLLATWLRHQRIWYAEPLEIRTTSPLPAAAVMRPYRVRLEAGGGVAPYVWRIAQGELPQHLVLDEDEGTILGMFMPSATRAEFTLEVTDQTGTLATRAVALATDEAEGAAQSAGDARPDEPAGGSRAHGPVVEKLLGSLEGDDRSQAIFALDYRQLCGQVATIVQAELSYPRARDEPRGTLFGVFTSGAQKRDVDRLRAIARGQLVEGEPKLSSEDEASQFADARQRLSLRVERRIDDLQAYLGRSWIQLSYVLAMSVTFAMLAAILRSLNESLAMVAALLLLCVLYATLAILVASATERLEYASLGGVFVPALLVGTVPLWLTQITAAWGLSQLATLSPLMAFAAGVLAPFAGGILDRLWPSRQA